MTATALAHCARHLVALEHHVHSAHLCRGASALRQRHACAQRTMNPKYGCPPPPPPVPMSGWHLPCSIRNVAPQRVARLTDSGFLRFELVSWRLPATRAHHYSATSTFLLFVGSTWTHRRPSDARFLCSRALCSTLFLDSSLAPLSIALVLNHALACCILFRCTCHC